MLVHGPHLEKQAVRCDFDWNVSITQGDCRQWKETETNSFSPGVTVQKGACDAHTSLVSGELRPWESSAGLDTCEKDVIPHQGVSVLGNSKPKMPTPALPGSQQALPVQPGGARCKIQAGAHSPGHASTHT